MALCGHLGKVKVQFTLPVAVWASSSIRHRGASFSALLLLSALDFDIEVLLRHLLPLAALPATTHRYILLARRPSPGSGCLLLLLGLSLLAHVFLDVHFVELLGQVKLWLGCRLLDHWLLLLLSGYDWSQIQANYADLVALGLSSASLVLKVLGTLDLLRLAVDLG